MAADADQGDEDLYAWNDELLNRAVALTEQGAIDIVMEYINLYKEYCK